MIDLKELQSQLEKVIAYSQDIDINELNCERIIHEWWASKKWILPYLNDQLIWETDKSVSFEYTDKMKEDIFDNFVAAAMSYLLREELEERCRTWEEWIMDNKQGFFNNSVINPLPSSEMKVGMKLIKAFKFFEFNDESVRYIQDLASQFIQKNKLEGILCISIHPLDYMTVSENNMKWRSCHALDGEYRAGNLSYMIDPSTIVCYIKSTKDTQLNMFPQGMMWNNKKWRMLMHVHSNLNIAYINRQYPFSSDEIIACLQYTSPMMKMHFSRSHYIKGGFREVNCQELHQNYFVLKGFVMDPKILCSGDDKSLQYNDFVNSPIYTPEYILGEKLFFFERDAEQVVSNFSVEIGRRVPCPCCGEWLTDSDSFICEHCQDDYEYEEEEEDDW